MRTIFAGVVGNALEWYDFTIYAFFAPILAGIFFPSHDPYVSLLLTFSVFALGFLVRPLGGIFFGYVGDHFGRRIALILSILVMSIPTILLAFMPSYNQIGVAAPILFTLIRLIQGTAVSGELTTATAYLVEHAADNKRGFAGSLAMCSAFAGIMLSSAMATIMSSFLDPDALALWGWRAAFAIGGVAGLVGLIVRIYSPETKLYQQQTRPQQVHSHYSVLKHFVKLNWQMVMTATFLTFVMAVGNYFLIGYFNIFLIKQMGLSMNNVMLINLVCLILFTILLPIMGIFSDHIGRKRVLGTGMIAVLLLSYPTFWLLTQKSILAALLGELLFVFALSPVAGIIPTILAELFETHNRNAGLSMGYNLSLAMFGGTAPLVALSLVKYTHNYFSPAYYLMGAAIISFLVLIRIKESYQDKLI